MTIRLILATLSMAVTFSGYAADFSLTRRDIADNRPLTSREVFQGFGCEGCNTSPELSWINAPAGTKSYAITVYDPDAPTGSGRWHWTVVNLPASTNSLPRGVGENLPVGAV